MFECRNEHLVARRFHYYELDMKRSIFLLVALICMSTVSMAAIDKKAEIARLRGKLSQTTSRKDSIKILYDIFDLSSRKDYLALGREIDAVAERAGNNEVRYDMARHLANAISNDSILALIEAHVKSLPSCKEQKETALFVKIRRLSATARYITEKERQNKIARVIVPEDNSKMDGYAKVERLFTICEYLSSFAKGDLLVEYLDDLGRLIKETGIENYAVKNIYLTESANIYSVTGNKEKAIACDRALLKEIDGLEKRYRAQGRKYRSYDINRFVVYRRMLSNYEVLSLDEVNSLYSKILDIAAVNDDVRGVIENNKRAAVYHAMKNKRYAEAIPYIRHQLSVERSQVLRQRMLEMLIEAAVAVGDKTTEDLAQKELDAIADQMNSKEARDKYNELQIRYDVSALRAENAELELENKNGQIAATQRIMIFVIVGWVAFAIMLVALLFFWTRYKRTAADISSFVDSLAAERDAIKKRRYYDYAKKTGSSVQPRDYISSRPKLGNLSDTIDYIINDVMFISSIALEDTRKFRHTISVGSFMKDSIDNVESRLTKNININVVYPDPDFEIRVDKQCLQMLVNHILNVAVRLAPEGGAIGFECTEDKASRMARFVFKHTGDSFPEGREEKIFEHFFDYRKLSEDGEAALIMCRMINFLTNSSLKSSAGHTHDGKLVLMVPMS